MNDQTCLLTYCWLFLLNYFFLPGGALVQKAVKAVRLWSRLDYSFKSLNFKVAECAIFNGG